MRYKWLFQLWKSHFSASAAGVAFFTTTESGFMASLYNMTIAIFATVIDVENWKYRFFYSTILSDTE